MTTRQAQLLDYLRRRYHETGRPVSVRDAFEGCGFTAFHDVRIVFHQLVCSGLALRVGDDHFVPAGLSRVHQTTAGIVVAAAGPLSPAEARAMAREVLALVGKEG